MRSHTVILGNVGRAPETKDAGGHQLTKFSVAVNDNGRDKDTGKDKPPTWYNVTCWDKLADACAKYLSKGSKVQVEGRMVCRTYEKDGQKHYAWELNAHSVEFLSPAPGDSKPQARDEPEDPYPPADDSEVPF